MTQDEFLTVPGSLLRKAQTAQSVFDNKFLLPFAPDRPEFFLVPGNNQVTVLWARSPTETNPDPFFAVASEPRRRLANRSTTRTSAVWTSRATGSIAAGWTIRPSSSWSRSSTTRRTRRRARHLHRLPRTGESRLRSCAPELGVFIACDPALLPPPPPGTPFTGSQAIDLTGTITQLTPGNRVLLASGEAQTLPGVLDTAFADVAAGRVAQGASFNLANTGVPFLFIDRSCATACATSTRSPRST